MVAVAQLVRALDCGSRGRGFNSHQPPQISKHDYVSNRRNGAVWSFLLVGRVFLGAGPIGLPTVSPPNPMVLRSLEPPDSQATRYGRKRLRGYATDRR